MRNLTIIKEPIHFAKSFKLNRGVLVGEGVSGYF